MKNRNFLTDLKKVFFSKNALSRIILINSVVYLFYLLSEIFFSTPVLQSGELNLSRFSSFLALPSNTETLISHPWAPITYMFLHENFLQIIFYQVTLYFIGTLLIQSVGERKFLFTYLIGGISGAVFFILSYSFLPVFHEIKPITFEYSSAAPIISVLAATALLKPNNYVRIFGLFNLQFKYIIIAFFILDIYSIPENNPGTYILHSGAALWGLIYAISLRNNFKWHPIFDPLNRFLKNIFKPKPKLRVEYKKDKPLSDDDYNKIRAENQKKMDSILDKISRSGYDSLSKAEKEFLFSSGNKK